MRRLTNGWLDRWQTMQDKPKTARFGTTLFLDNPLHRQAWELLSAIPAGQRTNWLCLALCQQAQREQFLLDLKTILQTELQNSSDPQTISRPQPAGSVDDDVLGFLRALQEEGDECRTILQTF